jgi:hypothetical protein
MYGTTAPALAFAPSFAAIEPMKFVSILAWTVFVVWLLYTLIAAYHWLRYSHGSLLAIPALAVHLFVSLSLALFSVSGFK